MGILENELGGKQHEYVQLKYALTQMKARSESYQTKQQTMKTQLQVASNHIKYVRSVYSDSMRRGIRRARRNAQHRVRGFDEQLSVCRHDLIEQETSMAKLREFHSALKEQDATNLKKLLTIHIQRVGLEYQYKLSRASLEQTGERWSGCVRSRSVFARMVVRRVNLCQLLYKRLARVDKHIEMRDRRTQLMAKCVTRLIGQIHQIRHQNRRSIERTDHLQLEVSLSHSMTMSVELRD